MPCGEAIKMLGKITNDRGVPRNIKEMIEESVGVLRCKKPDSEKVSHVVSILDEASNDPNISVYTRTQIWNVVSLLETVKNEIV